MEMYIQCANYVKEDKPFLNENDTIIVILFYQCEFHANRTSMFSKEYDMYRIMFLQILLSCSK